MLSGPEVIKLTWHSWSLLDLVDDTRGRTLTTVFVISGLTNHTLDTTHQS